MIAASVFLALLPLGAALVYGLAGSQEPQLTRRPERFQQALEHDGDRFRIGGRHGR
jgi:hypothetical protein